MERTNGHAKQSCGLKTRPGIADLLATKGRYEVTCRDKDGNIKWVDHIDNLITDVGANDMLDKHLEGSSYTAAWYAGLVNNAGFSAYAAGDTMSSHAGWAESDDYDEATRPQLSFAAASSRSKATDTAAEFTIDASVTIKGIFVASNSTKSGTTGVLLSVGNFSGGDRAVVDNDVISVSYSLSLS